MTYLCWLLTSSEPKKKKKLLGAYCSTEIGENMQNYAKKTDLSIIALSFIAGSEEE